MTRRAHPAPRHRRPPVAVALVTLIATSGVLMGCTTGSASSSTSATSGASSSVTETNPPGDIPDNIAYVPHTVPGTQVTFTVPEGWSKSEKGKSVFLTDKLNSAKAVVSSASAAPTVASVKQTDVPLLKKKASKFVLGDVSHVTRKGGQAVLVTYQADSAASQVTGKVVRDAVERYTYWDKGTRVDLTLTGPVGADNVDPWKIISDSVTVR